MMSENKYLVYLDDNDAKNKGCISGWYIHDIKIKKTEKELIAEVKHLRDGLKSYYVPNAICMKRLNRLIEKWEEKLG